MTPVTTRSPVGTASVRLTPAVTQVDNSGIYYLQYRGKKLVRHIEVRIGEGMLLRSENSKSKPTVLKNLDSASDLEILGRVTMVLNACRL